MLRPAEVGKGRSRCGPGLQALGGGCVTYSRLGYTEAVKAPGRRCAPVDGGGLERRRGRKPRAHLLHCLFSTAYHSLH